VTDSDFYCGFTCMVFSWVLWSVALANCDILSMELSLLQETDEIYVRKCGEEVKAKHVG
jgi:hypothetical protein